MTRVRTDSNALGLVIAGILGSFVSCYRFLTGKEGFTWY